MWGAVTACKKTAEDIEVAFKVSDLWRVCVIGETGVRQQRGGLDHIRQFLNNDEVRLGAAHRKGGDKTPR